MVVFGGRLGWGDGTGVGFCTTVALAGVGFPGVGGVLCTTVALAGVGFPGVGGVLCTTVALAGVGFPGVGGMLCTTVALAGFLGAEGGLGVMACWGSGACWGLGVCLELGREAVLGWGELGEWEWARLPDWTTVALGEGTDRETRRVGPRGGDWTTVALFALAWGGWDGGELGCWLGEIGELATGFGELGGLFCTTVVREPKSSARGGTRALQVSWISRPWISRP
jgi:hypothetical protein